MGIAIKEIVRLSLGVYPSANDDRNNQPINPQHSSHNHRHNRLHHKLRPHNTHWRHSHPTLRSPVRCSHTFQWSKKQQSISSSSSWSLSLNWTNEKERGTNRRKREPRPRQGNRRKERFRRHWNLPWFDSIPLLRWWNFLSVICGRKRKWWYWLGLWRSDQSGMWNEVWKKIKLLLRLVQVETDSGVRANGRLLWFYRNALFLFRGPFSLIHLWILTAPPYYVKKTKIVTHASYT